MGAQLQMKDHKVQRKDHKAVKGASDAPCCCGAASTCTACGGTCDNTLETIIVDLTDLSNCSDCLGSPPYFPIGALSDSLALINSGHNCPDVTWASAPWPPYEEHKGYVQLWFSEYSGCYFLAIFCLKTVIPFLGPVWSTIWYGCKGGDSPVGTYTCQDDGAGGCEGCNGGPNTVVVTDDAP